MPRQRCAWPGCAEESDRPFRDGWSSYSDGDGLPRGMPADGFLCPAHKLAFDALVVDEQPPTDNEH
jgi:hypothetical protein